MLFKWPLVLLPVHIVFLELIIDPACSTVFEAEPEEAGLMNRPPRNPKEPLFGRRTVVLSVLQGLSVLLVALAVFGVSMRFGRGAAQARAMAYTTLVVSNLALILCNRSWSRTIISTLRSPNRALWWVLGGATLFMSLILFVPALRELFRFSPLHWDDVAVCVGAGLASILWFEGLKLVNGRRRG